MYQNLLKSKKKQTEVNDTKLLDIHQHLHLLVLRKSARKLLEYISYFNKRKDAINEIINIKYELNKCRPEVLSILIAMARDPKRFVFRDSSTDTRMVFDDSMYENMYFQVYNFRSRSSYDITEREPLIKIYINSKRFLTEHEELMMYYIVKSLDYMKQNEYTLQKDLENLEVQNNVFKIYQSEKK